MNKEQELIRQLRELIVQREKTIEANKREMRDFLKKYKKALELEKTLIRECKNLKKVVNHLREIEKDKIKLKNSAPNRNDEIVRSNEE